MYKTDLSFSFQFIGFHNPITNGTIDGYKINVKDISGNLIEESAYSFSLEEIKEYGDFNTASVSITTSPANQIAQK